MASLKRAAAGTDEQPVTTRAIAPEEGALRHASTLASALASNLSAVVRGKPEAVRLAVVALLSGGHLLVEDVPGVGKTMLAKALARSVGGSFRRVQGTPDLLPADLTGVSVLDPAEGTWRFRPGPLFANVVLVDEVNRATPRTQSALLEAMEERQVTADGGTLRLPDPFMVVATQNPHEHAGTFPLVEAQRDRFAMVVEIGLPARDAEREILAGVGGSDALRRLEPVAEATDLRGAIAAVRSVHVAPAIVEYLLDLAHATREHQGVTLGASPRATLGSLRAAQANAVAEGRAYVIPDDVKAVAAGCLAHRLILGSGPSLEGGRAVVEGILRGLPPPRG